jgi:sugar lactone lactonase YvrE
VAAVALLGICVGLTACGGSADAPPTITQQPADQSVTAGQAASFSVVATGAAPLVYQWQRNSVDIAGANATTYSVSVTAITDSGALFRAVVSNAAGTATSTAATLTVMASAPVLTITQQPANATVVAGTQASFTLAATCSSGTLDIQWQRSQGSGAGLTWGNIALATVATYSFSTLVGDDGAQFRALLDCSGQSATPSNAAALTVTPPGTAMLGLLPTVGLRDQAEIAVLSGIDQDPSGSFTFITNNRVQRLSADLTTITPVAGGISPGSADGPAATASFSAPFGLTQDGAGNVYVADYGNETIRRIAPDGTVSTLAGLAGAGGTVDGTGSAARFNRPSGIAMGPDGDLYIAEIGSHLIRRVTTSGVVTTYAGSTAGYADGAPLSAQFNSPRGVAVASNGDVLVADTLNNRIRRIVRNGTVAGAVQTLAGNGTAPPEGADGVGIAAVIPSPETLVIRGNTLTLTDLGGLLRQIDLTTTAVTTLTGSRLLGPGYADGTATTARLNPINDAGVTGAANGGFLMAGSEGLRLVSATGAVRTIAAVAAAEIFGTQGLGVLAQIPFGLATNDPQGVTVDPAGNVVVADFVTAEVRRISPAGVVTLAAGLTGGNEGSVDGVGSEAQFTSLGYAIASDSNGVLYVADNFGLRRIGADNATTQPAGSTTTFGAVDGIGGAARFNRILGLAVGPGGNVFVGDAGNNAVRRIDPAGNVTTYAGVMGQSAHVDGPIAAARFEAPADVAFAPDGALYVSDNRTLRRIAPDGSSVSTIAAVSGLTRFAIDAAGTVYYGDLLFPSGLYMLPQGGVSTLLIPTGNAIVLGASPRLLDIDAIAVMGPKQLVILSGAQILQVTLP